MNLRFNTDPETGQPHIYDHGVSEDEVRQVMARPGRDYPGKQNSRMKLGQTSAGRYLLVVYAPDEGGHSAFVITARQLKGKALKAFRQQQKKRKQ